MAAEPQRIFAVVEALEQFQQQIKQLPAAEEMAAQGKLIRDLTG